jgi:ribosomal protein S16
VVFLYGNRTARNSKPLEVLGTFDPLPQRPPRDAPADARPTKAVQLDVSRAKYWLGVGAQPSDGAWELLEKVRLFSSGRIGGEADFFALGRLVAAQAPQAGGPVAREDHGRAVCKGG